MNKKRYLIIIAIVIFIFLALFTFANPLNNEEGETNDNRVLEEVEEDDLAEQEEQQDEKEETEEQAVIAPEYPIYNNHGVVQKPQVEVDTSYEVALKAVEKLEITLNNEDLEETTKLVEKVKDEEKKEKLEERLEVIFEIFSLTEDIETLVSKVNNASNKADMDSSRSFVVSKDIVNRLDKISNKVIKDLLLDKLESIAEKVEDTNNPKVNIEDGAILNSDTKITVTDESEVTIKLNDKEILNNTVVGNGIYTLVVTDGSFNATTIKFIVDNQKPKFNIEDGLFSIEDVNVVITDLSFDYVEILDVKTNAITVEKSNEFVLNKSGEYTLTAYDKLGNNEQISIIIEKEYNEVSVLLEVNDTVTKYATLIEALEVLKNENVEEATVTVYGNQEINVVNGFGIGGPATKEITFIGGNSKAKITNVGNGHTNISATNPEAVITFENLILADTTRYTESKTAPYTDWEFSYSDYAGNFNFTNVEFERSPMLDANGTHDVSYNLTNCTFKQYDDEAKDLRYSVWVYSGAKATIKNSTFTGARGIKIHKNYEKEAKAGKIVIDNNTFESLSKKPGIAVGTITNLATIIEITNNTFTNVQPGDQGNYSYESDTVGPTIYSNNIVDGQLIDLDTSSYEKWLNNQTQVTLEMNHIATKYATLTEALEVLKNENVEEATVTVYGNQEINVVNGFGIGGPATKEITFIGGNSKAKITNVGNGHTNISATNPEAVITFENLILADTTRYTESKTAPYTDWEFSYSDYAGNFNFTNVEFERSPMLDANGTHDVSYNLTNCTFKQYDDEAKDLRYSVWVYSGAKATIKNSTFTGARGIKIHKNYEKEAKAGKIVIDNNTFESLSKKPGIAVGTITNLATIIEITNNTFTNVQPGDQGNYSYESDTVGPTIYSNNIVDGVVENKLRNDNY